MEEGALHVGQDSFSFAHATSQFVHSQWLDCRTVDARHAVARTQPLPTALAVARVAATSSASCANAEASARVGAASSGTSSMPSAARRLSAVVGHALASCHSTAEPACVRATMAPCGAAPASSCAWDVGVAGEASPSSAKDMLMKGARLRDERARDFGSTQSVFAHRRRTPFWCNESPASPNEFIKGLQGFCLLGETTPGEIVERRGR